MSRRKWEYQIDLASPNLLENQLEGTSMNFLERSEDANYSSDFSLFKLNVGGLQ